MRRLGIGVVGCGNISMTYLRNAALFPGVELRACADLSADLARQRAAEYGIRAEPVEALLVAEDVDLVLNLTVPNAHSASAWRPDRRQARVHREAAGGHGQGGQDAGGGGAAVAIWRSARHPTPSLARPAGSPAA